MRDRDRQADFDDLGVHIVGVGFDDPEDNRAWAEDEGFAFELWTDDDRTLALTYGAADDESASFADRITVILDEAGELVVVYPQVNVGTHPELVLEDCRTLFGE